MTVVVVPVVAAIILTIATKGNLGFAAKDTTTV